jgi:Protein of unknown function (DUF3455)
MLSVVRLGSTREHRFAWVFALALSFGCHPVPAPENGASAAACAADWLQAPAVDPSLAVPSGNDRVVLHAAASGTQNYACSSVTADGGASYAWSPAGPEATLSDCHSTAIGHHMASDAGPAAPEWQTLDGAYVVGHKVTAKAKAAGSVPWLLLSVDRHGGTGPLTEARFVQRVATSGGAAPTAPCDGSLVGTMQKVPYTADYYFFAP